MPDILAVVSPIYAIILLGFLATRGGLFHKADMRVFGKFVISFALPALLFQAIAERHVAEIVNTGYLLAYLLGSLAVIAGGYALARRVLALDRSTSAVYAMGMSCSNSGFIGYPILLLLLPAVASVALALNMVVENLVVIPLLLLLAERGRGDDGEHLAAVLKRVLSNPMIWGLMAGFVVSLTGWQLPRAVTQTIHLFALTSGALSLFVVGGTLTGLTAAGAGRRVWPIVAGKLVLHPVCVLAAFALLAALGLPVEPSLRTAAVLMAAMPMMSIYTTLAQAYGHEDFSAAALLAATVASFFTLSALLWVLRH
jgi:predicted permease